LTIPLAKHGISMTGLDFTPSMLSRAKEKAYAQGVDITWVQGDMREFTLARKFNLIFMAMSGFAKWQIR
jgi:2-polyprenyl-3-methyl-5-hydroxy-6-metoxy-1,4-benzoquinol methylase